MIDKEKEFNVGLTLEKAKEISGELMDKFNNILKNVSKEERAKHYPRQLVLTVLAVFNAEIIASVTDYNRDMSLEVFNLVIETTTGALKNLEEPKNDRH